MSYEMSPSVGELFQALAKAQSEVEAAPKTQRNAAYKRPDGTPSLYADLLSIWGVAKAALPKHGLSVVQMPRVDDNHVSVTTMIGHASGEWIASTVSARARDAGPQAVGSCITYLRRYGLAAMVGVVADDDDDGNAGSGVDAPTAPRTARATGAPRGSKADGKSADRETLRLMVEKFRAALDETVDEGVAEDLWLDAAPLRAKMPAETRKWFEARYVSRFGALPEDGPKDEGGGYV